MRVYTSPDAHNKVVAYYTGELKFGPSFFSLQINQEQLPNRIFSEQVFWSESSKYCVVVEWRSAYTPNSQLAIFDVDNKKNIVIQKNGRFQNIHFKGDYLYFGVEVIDKVLTYKVDLKRMEHWTAYNESGSKRTDA